MYARRYPPPIEEITVPENYSGNQFQTTVQEEDGNEAEAASVAEALEASHSSDFKEEMAPDAPALSECEEEEAEPFSRDNVLLLLAVLLSESSLGENIELFLLLLLLI